MVVCEHILAKGKPDYTPLFVHISHVAVAIQRIAESTGMDIKTAKMGAILHDVGKASPIFQERLKEGYIRRNSDKTFRHELASLFFLSLSPEYMQHRVIEMIIAHHKSVKNDPGFKGVLDLEENIADVFALHIEGWELWSEDALKILGAFGLPVSTINISQAEENYYRAVDYIKKKVRHPGYSEWKGLLMAADHFASAMISETENQSKRIFRKPNLQFYERKSSLYPLSVLESNSDKKHTLVVACTGSGKTDFLFRRCKSRVFYTLPYQASINAMYRRVATDLSETNLDLDIRVLHSASSIIEKNSGQEEVMMQGLVGSGIKVLTPHQIAGIVFGTKGFEATILDLKGNDVILDEIHTYTEISRAIVIKIVEVLSLLGCRLHVGTATMPTHLYDQIIDLLGKDNVYEVRLPDKVLGSFDRHIIHKLDQWRSADSLVDNAIGLNKKILIVCNRVLTAQTQYQYYKKRHPETPILLLHSRFKRGDRNRIEKQLLGIDEKGQPTFEFNTSLKACIVVSTQVVEVSLDISFDLMITETAPLDSLIQRFGRVNRVRTAQTIGVYKPVYLISPPDDPREALPYDVEILKKSFSILPDGEVLHESELQKKIDHVFPVVDLMDIETHAMFKKGGGIALNYLTHRPKSYLLELLEIDNVSCIASSDVEKYSNSGFEGRLMLEIPAIYWQVKDLSKCEYGNSPFIVPDHSYNDEIGFDVNRAKQEFCTEENYL